MCYTKKKSYYDDGHDRKDVLAYHEKWLARELKLELCQYLWAPFTDEDLHKCEFTKYGKKLSLYDFLFTKADAGTDDDTGGGNEDSVDEAQRVRDKALAASFESKLYSVFTVLLRALKARCLASRSMSTFCLLIFFT